MLKISQSNPALLLETCKYKRMSFMCLRKRGKNTELTSFLLKESGEDHCSMGQIDRGFVNSL